MPLEEYKKKRDFERTPEPGPQVPEEQAPALRFVVQKHAASHLHYDFRLELDGVLKSWAVPKGPSLNPEDKRLAMMVEDHPLDYRSFEGIIPEGNYGAGTVMVWDEGTYEALGATDLKDSIHELHKGLAKGDLKIFLRGDKLKGSYALVKTRGREENAWLLIKKRDDFASTQDVRLWDRSVVSGRSMEEIAAAGDATWESNRKNGGSGGSAAAAEPKPAEGPTPPARRSFAGEDAAEAGGPESSPAQAQPRVAGPLDLARLDLTGSVPGEPPEFITPMLARLTDTPFDRTGWIFELKWDGYRAIADIRNGNVRLYSRKALDFSERYAGVVEDLKKIDVQVVLDGEIVVLDEKGRPQFKLLQNWMSEEAGRLVYFVFDVLFLEGRDLRPLPLARRKAVLKAILPSLPRVQWSDYIEEKGAALFQSAKEMDLEGVIAKDMTTPYRAGSRTNDWLKVKTHLTQSAVIAGFTEPRGGRKDLGALVLGVYEEGELVYIGHTGGGFDEKELARVKERLAPLATSAPAFKTIPPTNAPATWVEPKVVAEVKFSEWSKDGIMRQPIYLGLRDDLDPEAIQREHPTPIAKAVTPRRYIQKSEGEEVVIDGRKLMLTNLDKVLWPEEGYTKRDLISYYRGIAPLILPYLRDRPESMHRHPNGINGESFFHKDVSGSGGGGQAPAWAETLKVSDEPDAETYLLCQDEATLVWMANMGCIEINPWSSHRGSLDRPDYMVIDLDPLEIAFGEVIRTALVVHEVLESAEIPNYVKTSGATGLHIFIPLGAQYTWDQTREFGQLVAYLVNDRLPDITSVARSPNDRKGKIYLDYLQNRRGQTIAAAYGLRPKPGAPVSTPLRWDEVKPGLSPRDFHMTNIGERIAEVGDLWKPVLGKGIDMTQALKGLERVAKR